MGFRLPGEPIVLADLDLTETQRNRLTESGQEFTYRAETDSTALSVSAAAEALNKTGRSPDDIGLVITAPTLLSAYGFEIPAVAVCAELGIRNAETLNIAQGCVGALAAIRQAALFLKSENSHGDVLIVTSCRASTLTDNFTHGAFFWGDAAAALVLTSSDRLSSVGLEFLGYAESSATESFGAMRLGYGDHMPYRHCVPEQDLRIIVDFVDARAQADYIANEEEHCHAVIGRLLEADALNESDVKAVLFPSFGKNRVRMLLGRHKTLIDRVASDFRFAHMGGVDVLLFLDKLINSKATVEGDLILIVTPAFTAQWGGILVRAF